MESTDVQTADRTGPFADLRELIQHDGPYLTAIVPARSDVTDAADRFRIHAGNALGDAPSEWSDDVSIIEAEISELHHGDGATLVAIRPHGGPTFYEFVTDHAERPSLSVGPLPRLTPLIDARQRTIAHVVVDTDLAGADITAFDGGQVVTQQQVEGDTTYIHRGHPGGWSQRRFQQRAENTWDHNAREVSETVRAVVDSVGARLTLVTGPTRAQSMLVSLLELQRMPVRAIDAGDPAGIADEIVRRIADLHAADTVAVLDEAKERIGHRADSARHVETALAEGRVHTLLVHDSGGPSGAGDDRLVDRCIAAALATGADIRVVPNVALLDRGVAATLRW